MICRQDYDLSLVLYHTTFLVDVVQEDIGRVLKLDSMQNASEWLAAHLLVFNTWHWWTYRGASQVYVCGVVDRSYLHNNKATYYYYQLSCSRKPTNAVQVGLRAGRE